MNTTQRIFTGISTAAILLVAVPAFAQNTPPAPAVLDASVSASVGGASVSASTKVEARITTGKNRATQEIDRRVTMLNDLNTKVQGMIKLSADEKASLAASISTQLSAMATLKAKIDADTDITTLKSDIKSITASYRIFMLVIPQGRIQVAVDKVGVAASTLSTLSGKLQTRISSAQAAGKDVASLSTSLTDMNAKLADANVQISAAASETASLTPDNGDTTKMQANNQTLKDARGKIQVALKDLQTARQDAGTIVTGLKRLDASASASGAASVQ